MIEYLDNVNAWSFVFGSVL